MTHPQGGAAAPPRRRHLIDPANPPPRSSSAMSLTQVQAWVLSCASAYVWVQVAGPVPLGWWQLAVTVVGVAGALLLAARHAVRARRQGRR